MLADIKNDLLHLLNILEAIEKIRIYSSKTETAEDFFHSNDQLNFNASLNLFAHIGETVKKLSSQLKEKYNDIPWRQVQDLRNRIAHDYMGIDIFVVFRIIKNDLTPIEEKIFCIISTEINNKNFDAEEMRLARESFYYRHIPFEKIN